MSMHTAVRTQWHSDLIVLQTGCTDTSDLRHFGPNTYRHWCRSVSWTLRHH